MLEVLSRLSEVTPEWATAALERHHPAAVVGTVEVVPLGEGTNVRARLLLSYTRGEGPPSLFVKMAGRGVSRLALMALGALTTEARLAAAGIRLPLEHPLFHGGGWTRGSAVVVADDVEASGGRPNTATSPLPRDEVASALAELACLHAAYWERPLPHSLAFVRPWRLGRRWAPVSAASLRRGFGLLARVGRHDLVPPGLDAVRLEREFRLSAVRAATGPQTLLHGDPHPGNTYRSGGGGTGFYDWQLVRTGNWCHDVSYFIVGSLDVEDRRRHEGALLASYLDVLTALGVRAPSRAEAWEGYRRAPAFGYGTWLHTLSAGLFQPRDVCLVTLERFAAAYRELG